MKKNLLLLLMPLLALTLWACNDKDDDEPNVKENEVIFDGDSYDIGGGAMVYYGANDDDSENVDLWLYSEDGESAVYFELNVPDGNDELVAGTYNYSYDNYSKFKLSGGAVVDLYNESGLAITAGNVKVALSGSTYTITFDCEVQGGLSLEGKYKGKLTWYDSDDFEDYRK